MLMMEDNVWQRSSAMVHIPGETGKCKSVDEQSCLCESIKVVDRLHSTPAPDAAKSAWYASITSAATPNHVRIRLWMH